MIRSAFVMAGIVLSVTMADLARAETAERASPEKNTTDVERERAREREQACDCCARCKAVQKQLRGKDEGPPAKDGCLDCCRRCGTGEYPPVHQMPPEIVR